MIELQLLGGLAVRGPDLSDSAATRRRHPLALLAMVAASAPQPVGRDKLMAYLWPESNADRASNSLRQTLFRIRRDLGEEIFLPESAMGIQLDPSKLEVDLWSFRAALERAAPEDAVAVYGGRFLDGFHIAGLAEFTRWVESEGNALERQYGSALDTLARTAEESGRLDKAVSWRRKQAAVDPYSSRVALALLETLVAAGDRTGALRYASVYENMVRDALDTDPDAAVEDFVTALREGRVAVGAPPRRAEAVPAGGGAEAGSPETRESPSQGPDDATEVPAATRSSADPGSRVVGPAVMLVALVLIAVAAIEWRATLAEPADEPLASVAVDGNVVLLGSGRTTVDGRDPETRLISCEGPACPTEELPAAAFVVPKHPVYASAVGGTGFISPVPNGTTNEAPGFTCCTTAVFETEFDLPPDAVSGRISVTALADNHASVSVNGIEFGQHEERDAPENYGQEAPAFGVTFLPDPSGTNRLRLTLWNVGGAIALQYYGVVTYEVVFDADGDGIQDSVDVFPRSDFRPTVVVGDCDSDVVNRIVPGSRGATLGDLVAERVGGSSGTEEIARAVSALAAEWRGANLISESDRGRLASCAARAGGFP